MKKNKLLKAIVPATLIVGSISPILASCNKSVSIKSITAEFRSGRKFYKVGETIKANDILVTALYESGETKILQYDKDGKSGYTVVSDGSTYTLDHKFTLNDLKRDCILKIKYSETTFDFKYDVDYSENINLYLDNVTIDSVSEVKRDNDIVVTYKPKDESYCTILESTGVEIDGKTYNAYDNPDVITFDWDRLNGATKSVKLVVDKSLVTSESVKIQIVDEKAENVCRIAFNSITGCEIKGSKFTLVPVGQIKWKDVPKPEVVAKSGLMFTKWVDKDGNDIDDETVINDDMSVTTYLDSTNIKVTLDASGGCEVTPSSILVPSGIKWGLVKNQITVNLPQQLKFLGWFNGETEIPNDFQITAPFTATAKAEIVVRRKISLEAKEHCTIATGLESIYVDDGTTWEQVKIEADKRVIPDEKCHFVKWTDMSGNDIPLGQTITSDLRVMAWAEPLGEFTLDIRVPLQDEYSYYKYIEKEPEGTEINPLSFSQIDRWDGQSSVPGWNPVKFENNKLIFESPKKNDAFRFIYQIIEIKSTVPAGETKEVKFKFNLKDETWLNGYVTWSHSYHTTQIFDLGNEHWNNPGFFTNTRYNETDFDEKDKGHFWTSHKIFWTTEKHYSETADKTITLTLKNETGSPIVLQHYFGISYMIAARNNTGNGDQRGKLTTDISWELA